MWLKSPGVNNSGHKRRTAYSVRRRSLFAEPQPFWGYWEEGNDVLGVEFLRQPKLILGLA